MKPIYQVKVTYIRITVLTCGLKAGQPGIGMGTKPIYTTLWGGLESGHGGNTQHLGLEKRKIQDNETKACSALNVCLQ